MRPRASVDAYVRPGESVHATMQTASFELIPLFASPLVSVQLADVQALNGELEQLLLARESEPHRNPHPTHIPQREVFESDFDLFRWPEPCIQALRRLVLDAVGRVVATLNGYSAQQMSRLVMHNHTWFHITRHGGSFVAHNHPMASWSAVYCVRPGQAAADRPDSGVLRFLDHRPGSNMFLDPANTHLQAPYTFAHHSMRLQAGQLVIFPAYLVHEVAPFMGSDTRITIAANCWFTQAATP